MLTAPLKKMRLTQPFGVNYVSPGFYKSVGIPSDKHNGWDMGCVVWTDVVAPVSGTVFTGTSATAGKWVRIRFKADPSGEVFGGDVPGVEIFMCHLSEVLFADGHIVLRGQVIAHSGNTGTASSGPHLHMGIYPIRWSGSGAGPFFTFKDNGYLGAVDPADWFDPDVLKLPVDKGYGVEPVSVSDFYDAFIYILRTPGLWTRIGLRGYRALRWGRWDIRTVLDDSMWTIWTEMTKMEYEAKKKTSDTRGNP